MTWQEYQESVALLYEQLPGIGTVERNLRIPDRTTGQARQVDTLLTFESKGHKFQAVVDAKFHATPLDVKVIEEVVALANSVGVSQSIIVTTNGWTAPARKKADHLFCELRLLTLEQALDLLVPDKWMMCPSCSRDCIVMDQENAIQEPSGVFTWWIAGACRECRSMLVWCQACGEQLLLGRVQSCFEKNCRMNKTMAVRLINVSLTSGLTIRST